ncbi:putative ABC transport system permease protein [Duganella sacchari]|uniref:Putative ABC transport system permease protein n=1 Tax=Duganella sacchari TaxID=551987 RepID=A0A1M7MV55_9BURK|nr:FtsX-like permease family protein [Duganella sacchari]SHM94904.1 putative ABC transport system permease protein [Duganella sacchari]
MQIPYIVAALRKHRLATFLIALQISLACAVLCNACFLVVQRVQSTQMDSGIEEAALGTVKLSGFTPDQAADLNARMLAALQGIAGVEAVSVVNMVPFGEPVASAGVRLDQDGKHFGGVIDFYVGDAKAVATFGLQLLAGRLPQADDYTPIADTVPANPVVLITQTLASHFWPGQNPVGQQFWAMGTSFRVAGVVRHLSVAAPGGGQSADPDWAVFVPAVAGPQLVGKYLLRGRPADIARIVEDARAVANQTATDAVLDVEQSRTVPALRASYFNSSYVMALLLLGVCVALLGTTALGIVGLASFWVTQRSKQIGIRRALGATTGDILRYFQIENFIIVSLGITIGMLLAYGLNLGLMRFYELPHLPLAYLPVGAVALWILGQLAVLAPALRAAAIPPMAAIKAV